MPQEQRGPAQDVRGPFPFVTTAAVMSGGAGCDRRRVGPSALRTGLGPRLRLDDPDLAVLPPVPIHTILE